jgi:hypothetical protein
MPRLRTAFFGEVEVTVPADILDFEMIREAGETDDEFRVAEGFYRRLFAATLSKSSAHCASRVMRR